MLKLQPNPTFEWPVMIVAPGGEQTEIIVIFRHKGRTDANAFIDQAREMDDIDAMMAIVAGWRDVDGEFDRTNMASLIDAYPAAAPAIFSAWIAGLAGAQTKN